MVTSLLCGLVTPKIGYNPFFYTSSLTLQQSQVVVLMFKMSDAGEHHGHVVGVAIINRILIFYRATGLYHRFDAYFTCYFHAIWEREKCIRSHNGAFKFKPKVLRV